MIAIVAMGLSARVVEGGLCLGACTSGEATESRLTPDR
jgi:hypothetical protein